VYNTEENETILEKVWSAPSSDESEGASYQQDLWQMVLQRKTRNNRLTITGSSDTSELFLQSLTTAYNQNGLAQKMPRIREIFSDIEPFVSAINTMVQANAVAALVWGSLTLVFQVTSQPVVDKKNYLLTTLHIFSLSCGFPIYSITRAKCCLNCLEFCLGSSSTQKYSTLRGFIKR
jgi:hypothetical protein